MGQKSAGSAGNPGDYEGWYETPRGRWVSEVERRLLLRLLAPRPGDRLMDVGCGTGYFTRCLAQEMQGRVVGVDPSTSWLRFARQRAGARETYLQGTAEALPFPDGAFDLAVSIAALCFAEDPCSAVREMVRVTRRRFAVGLLNRRSLLYRRVGRNGGTGGYTGARWHTSSEARALFAGLPVEALIVRTCVFLPSGGRIARVAEEVLPPVFPLGALLVVAGSIGRQHPGTLSTLGSRRRHA